jgi:hypothetical protein
MSAIRLFVTCVLILAVAAGCNSTTGTIAGAPSVDSATASQYLLSSEPSDAKSILDLKTSAKDGEEITLVGRIGGSTSPFVAGRASFTVVDTSLTPCNERPGDSCPTPWDYCCDTDRLADGTAVVKVIDADGKTLDKDAEQDLGMKALQTVIVKGKAKRDEAGNLTVLAPAIFVKK